MYYRYIDGIVRGVGHDAESLLDVGAANAEYLEDFDWIPRRVALDKGRVYSSRSVEGVVTDFFTYQPPDKFDLVTCFQVLEHIRDAQRFARKLFDVGHSVLISVPYKWKVGDCKWHVHDPVDTDKLRNWTGREPDYSVIVSEILNAQDAKRLIAYYANPEKKFSILEAKKKMQESYAMMDKKPFVTSSHVTRTVS